MIARSESKQKVVRVSFSNNTFSEEELIQAEEKLEESKRLTEKAMFNILNNDVISATIKFKYHLAG